MLIVKFAQMIHSFPARNCFVGLAFSPTNRAFDFLASLKLVSPDFHHTAAVVGEQQIIFAVFFISDHVEWTVAVTKFRDSLSFDFRAGRQSFYRELNQWSTGVSRKQRGFVADVECNKRAYWRPRLKTPMRAVVNFYTRPVRHGLERKRN